MAEATLKPSSSPIIELRVLGTLALSGGAAGGAETLLGQPKALAVLIYLVLARPQGFQQRDRLAALFWPDLDQKRARDSLRKTLQRIRESLGEEIQCNRGKELVAASADRICCDARRFEECVDREYFREALELYRGELLPGFNVPDCREISEWLDLERAHYGARAVTAAWRLVDVLANQRDFTDATRVSRLVLQLAPTDERMLRRVLTLLVRLGDRAGALAAYDRFAERLWNAYETPPSPETERLVEAIKLGAPTGSPS